MWSDARCSFRRSLFIWRPEDELEEEDTGSEGMKANRRTINIFSVQDDDGGTKKHKGKRSFDEDEDEDEDEDGAMKKQKARNGRRKARSFDWG
jgi:hypothetical protein